MDRNALEEGLKLKEKLSGKVVVLTMDAPPARRALEEALAMGADEAVFLCDTRYSEADTLATARALSYGIRRLGVFDLILCGNESTAGATGHVGPQLAELLGLPHITYVRGIEVIGDRKFLVERALEHGYMKIEVRLPAVLAVVKEINYPRFPTVSGIMAAAEKEVRIWDAEEIGADPRHIGAEGSCTWVLRQFEQKSDRRREVLEGRPEEVVRKAVERLVKLRVI